MNDDPQMNDKGPGHPINEQIAVKQRAHLEKGPKMSTVLSYVPYRIIGHGK